MRRVKRVDAPYRSGLSKVYKQMLIDAGIETTLDSKPEKFQRSLAADVALWAPIVKALALKID